MKKEEKRQSIQFDEAGNEVGIEERIPLFDMFEIIWGTQKLKGYIEMEIYKYRYRICKDKQEDTTQTLNRIKWLDRALEFYQCKIKRGDDIYGMGWHKRDLPKEITLKK